MDRSIYLGLLDNAALLLAIVLLFDLIYVKRVPREKRTWQFFLGIIIGGIGILIILTPWVLIPGVIFDTRTVLLGVSGLFFGGIPTIIAMVITAAYRYALGGPAVWMGISTIITSGLIGIFWGRWTNKPKERLSAGELYLFGLVVNVVMLLCAFVMPIQMALFVLENIALPVLLIYPIATMLLSLLMVNRLRQEQRAEESVQLNRQLQAIVDILENPPESLQQFPDLALEQAIQMTRSKSGYLFAYSEKEQRFLLKSFSVEKTLTNNLSDFQDNNSSMENGILGEIVQRRQPILVNDFSKRRQKEQFPKGHISIHNYLGVPVFNENEMVAVVAVANKSGDYDEMDSLQLKLFMESVWKSLEALQINLALKTSEQRYSTMVNCLPYGLLQVVDQNLHYLYNAGEGLLQLGLTNDMLVGKTACEIYGEETGQQVSEVYRRVLQGETLRFEVAYADQIFMSQATLLPDPAGGELQILVLSVNITERKKAEQELQQAQDEIKKMYAESEQARLALLSVLEDQKEAEKKLNQLNVDLEKRVRERTIQLEAANKELEAFAYSVSHDLRAPLRALDGFSSALLSDYSDRLDTQGKHYLQRIREASLRMGQLIEDLLDLSRVTRREMNKKEINMSLMVKQIVNDLSGQYPIDEENYEITPNLMVNADPNLLRIALENLLNNALKFSSKREHPQIIFGTQAESQPKVYFVHDNGVGFNMAYADKLFTPFQRLHSSEEFPGTGIGLVTVQRIINRHEGTIWVNAEEDQGATFFFTLGGD